MARRFNRRDEEFEEELSNPRCVSLAGIIKFQPNRKKATGSWRPMQASDLVDGEDTAYDINNLPSSNPSTASLLEASLSLPQMNPRAVHQSGLTFERSSFFETPLRYSDSRSKAQALRDFQPKDDHHYEQIFGKLPDPIRLHEQMGQFDGQVVFIAHPNRDVSAHQWSSTFFQWVNIGRYAHFRGKVEGSLASDRLKELSVSQNPLEFFKLAAENREKLIKEHGRLNGAPTIAHQPIPTNIVGIESTATASYLTSEAVPVFTASQTPRILAANETNPKIPTTMRHTVREEILDDPFVAAAMPSTTKIPSLALPRTDKNTPRGSLDFSYEFPFRSITATVPVLNPTIQPQAQEQHFGKDRNNEELPSRLKNPLEYISQPSLRDVDFGEEAASYMKVSTRGVGPTRWNTLDDLRNRLQPKQEVTRRDYGATWMSGSGRDHFANSNYGSYHLETRPLSRVPGLTVANPHRPGSTLNTSAPPFVNNPRTDAIPGVKHSAVNGVNATSHALRFSDPDGQRLTREYEIANGLAKQPPTKQNFKGPFFTDTKPTASDPTISLSVPISDEEKLVNWFRDGHRPGRQQEYARTLMSTAASVNKPKSIGVIGEGLNSKQDRTYENTPSFVRLYENLSEYAEESRKNTERSYFTRAWKRPQPHMIDMTPGGNNSFFQSPRVATSELLARPEQMREDEMASMWGMIGSMNISSGAQSSFEDIMATVPSLR